ncbi:hypothetical protein C8R44DRAFT_723576 [Mycena epipterygia]|nr:hypothetical protein C8R44DRAFT_723576 [Mycena epipterygia]
MVLWDKLQTIYPHHITSLDVELRHLDNEILKTMCRVFPNVTELRVKTSILMWDNDFLGGDRPWEADDFFEALAEHSPLPFDIQKLAIHWEYIDGPTSGFGALDLNEVKEALISKHPAMKMLWIDGSEVMYLWRQGHAAIRYTNDGNPDTSLDCFNHHRSCKAEDAKERREDFRLLWETI